MEFGLEELNSEQLKPVLDTEGAILVTAGAGSGKTRLLTHRIAHLVINNGVKPYNILAITFTNKAAREMKERLIDMIPDADKVWVSTFHSMCVTILRKFIDRLGYDSNFSIYGEQEKERIIKEIVSQSQDDDDLAKKVIKVVSDCKNAALDEEDYLARNKHDAEAEAICECFKQYNARLKSSNALDFDDLLVKTLLLLKSVPECREYYSEKFRYIHIDEFQDTNTVQYELVKLLSCKYRNVMAVGDEDQSIYGWRGADITNIKNFIKDFNSKVYKLEQNYRSTKNIINAANVLIKNNTSRIDKNLWTEKGNGVKIEYYGAPTESAEADFVVRSISGLMDVGYSLSDMAILMRVNALSRPFEQRFLQYNIPCVIYGGFKFFDRKEIKDVLAYLKIIANHRDDEAITRVINFPKRGIGDGTVAQLKNYASLTGISLYDAIIDVEHNQDLPLSVIKKVVPFAAVLKATEEFSKTNDVYATARFIVKVLDLKTLYSEPTEENENRKMNIRELLNSIKEFTVSNQGASVAEYLQTVSLYSDTDKEEENSKITIATVHSAKGLEFKVVFVVGLEEGGFPISRALGDDDEIEEERRLMYVAITRAKERLYLTRARSRFTYGARKESPISRFIAEAGIQVPQETSFRAGFSERSDYGYGKGNYSRYSSDYDEEKDYSFYDAGKTTVPVYQKTAAPKKQSVDLSKFKVGTIVIHKKFGKGVILSLSPNAGNSYAEIKFERVGNMTLALEYAGLKTED
ncbi:MAG: exodeoxyribonuclease V subunit gamma [Clostridia bacterium]|nr:exodeoxyribonuclease V subunit gamma [Clostridia bacterium]